MLLWEKNVSKIVMVYSYRRISIWASKQERWITACTWSNSHQTLYMVTFNPLRLTYPNYDYRWYSWLPIIQQLLQDILKLCLGGIML